MSQVFQLTNFPIKPGTVTIKSADGSYTYTKGVDYELDEATGRVTWLTPTPPVEIRSLYDVSGSKSDLEPVINESRIGIDIRAGVYDRQLTVVEKPSYINMNHPSWGAGGDFYVYFDDSDTLVLDGTSYPEAVVRVCKVTTNTVGTITALSDDRIFITVSGGGGPITPGAPILMSARTDISGSIITLEFNKDMADPVGKHLQFTFTANGVSRTFSAASLGVNPKQIILNVTGSYLVYSQVLYASYTAGDVLASDGEALETFVDHYVVNHVPAEFLFVSGSLTAINTDNNAIMNVLPVINSPKGVGKNFDNLKVFTANYDSNEVTVVDPITRAVTATIAVGHNPYDICNLLNNHRVYVSNTVGDTVSVINTLNNTITATVPGFNTPRGSVPANNDSFVYVVNNGNNTVGVIETATNTLADTFPVGDSPIDCAMSLDGTKLYVTNSGDHTVSVVSTATRTILQTIIVGNNPQGVRVSPLGTYIAVVNKGDDSISFINTATHAVDSVVSVGSEPVGLTFKSTGLKLYVTNEVGGTVSVIDMLSLTLIDTITIGATAVGLVTVVLNIGPPTAPEFVEATTN